MSFRSRWAAIAVALAAAAVGAATAAGAGGPAAAKANLARYAGQMTWVAPGPAFDTGKAKGKTVWYIGVDMSVPILQMISGQLKEALGHVGASVRICDGKGNPIEWKRCADQAVAQKAAAIVVESFPPELIAPSIAAAVKAKIPVIDGNNGDPTGPRYKGTAARVAFQYSLSGRLTADWVIADSKGKAVVLILGTSDVPNAKVVEDTGMLGEFKKLCPGCKVTKKDIPIAQWSTNLGTLTQSSLNADPKLSYIIPVYDGMSTFVLPGIQQAGKSSKVKVATFNGDLDPMQNMARGNVITVDVGSHNAYEGWAYADQILRLITGGRPVPDEHVPARVFDRTNVKTLKLTHAAEISGEWYGPPTYKGLYLKLWGAK